MGAAAARSNSSVLLTGVGGRGASLSTAVFVPYAKYHNFNTLNYATYVLCFLASCYVFAFFSKRKY